MSTLTLPVKKKKQNDFCKNTFRTTKKTKTKKQTYNLFNIKHSTDSTLCKVDYSKWLSWHRCSLCAGGRIDPHLLAYITHQQNPTTTITLSARRCWRTQRFSQTYKPSTIRGRTGQNTSLTLTHTSEVMHILLYIYYITCTKT